VTDGQLLGAIVFGLFALAAGLICLGMREERKQRRHRYRPTYDNRFPHRDEFKAFMRDVK
jgi:hypothetical protein